MTFSVYSLRVKLPRVGFSSSISRRVFSDLGFLSGWKNFFRHGIHAQHAHHFFNLFSKGLKYTTNITVRINYRATDKVRIFISKMPIS